MTAWRCVRFPDLQPASLITCAVNLVDDRCVGVCRPDVGHAARVVERHQEPRRKHRSFCQCTAGVHAVVLWIMEGMDETLIQ
jgi:hypothetical protein